MGHGRKVCENSGPLRQNNQLRKCLRANAIPSCQPQEFAYYYRKWTTVDDSGNSRKFKIRMEKDGRLGGEVLRRCGDQLYGEALSRVSSGTHFGIP